MLRRFWPIGAVIIGARLLFANFMVTTAFRENFFDSFSTPIALILIIVGGYFLTKNYD
jgi:hypothetical protein